MEAVVLVNDDDEEEKEEGEENKSKESQFGFEASKRCCDNCGILKKCCNFASNCKLENMFFLGFPRENLCENGSEFDEEEVILRLDFEFDENNDVIVAVEVDTEVIFF